jgi:hypothetical protein
MMDLQEFRQEFINGIEAEAIELAEKPSEVFIRRIEDILVNDYSYLSELHSLFFEWMKGNVKYKSMSIDAQSLELSTNTLNLMFIHYNNGEMQTLNKDFTENAQRLVNFFENCIKGFFTGPDFDLSVPEVSFAAEIRRNYEDIHKIHLFLASTDKLSERLKTIPLPAITLANRTFQVELDVIDITKIYQTKLTDFRKEEITVETADFGVQGIPCIKAHLDSDVYESYLAIVPGAFLSDIYKKYGPRLLEANVRSFLSVRGAVNKGIRGTILNSPDKFFPYNNGISTTASAITTEVGKDGGLLITSFKDLQIINGGQTTASLASATIKDKAVLDGIYVQMKLTIIRDESALTDSEFVRNIAKFANSQNKVTAADLNSNHDFYVRMEEFSRKTYAPATDNNTYQTLWFFERARGQYDQAKMKMTKAQKETFERINPPKQVIKKTDIAKYVNSCDQKPYDVAWGAEVNLTRFQAIMEDDWKKSNTGYNVAYFRDLVAKAILFKQVEKTISHLDWYQAQKAYRAQLVTYTIAKLFFEIGKKKQFFNFKAVWERQSTPDFILDDAAKIALIAYEVFTDPSRPTGNVETYCKRKDCWDALKNKPFELSAKTLAFLVDAEEVKTENARSQKEQRFDNSVMADVEVFKIGAAKWAVYLEKGKAQGHLSGYEEKMLEIAIKYANNVYTSLKAKQAAEILVIKAKLDDLGIVV